MTPFLRTNRNASAFGSEIVSRLFAEAARLEYRWSNAGLADDFGSRMVFATARYLERIGTRRPDGSHRSSDEQREFALCLFRKVWVRNARKDAARRREIGIEIVSLELVLELGDAHCEAEFLEPDDLGGETGLAAVRILTARGWSRERAWALVLFYASGEDYEQTRDLLAERFEAPVTQSALRQWKCRYFEAGLRELTVLQEEVR